MSIGKRIATIRGDLTQKEFAGLFGIAKDTLARYERDEFPPKLEFLEALCGQKNINANWLLFGTGAMRKGVIPGLGDADAFSEAREGQAPLECLDREKYFMVPLLESRVTAGPEGEIIYDEVSDYLPFRKWWVERIAGRGEINLLNLILIKVRGDSMTPTINQGEIALVDTDEAERIQVQNGKVYLVIQPDGTTSVKRLAMTEKGGRPHLLCLSDNVAMYRPFEFELARNVSLKQYVLGRVRWAGKEFD